MLQSIHAVFWSIHSVKQEHGVRRRSKSPQVVEKAGSARACAMGTIGAWGVYPEADPGRSRANCCCIFDGGIDAGEPGGGEPPRRVSGGARRGGRCIHAEHDARARVPRIVVRGRTKRARSCRATCRPAPQERRHECGGQCAGIDAVAEALVRSMMRRRMTRLPTGATADRRVGRAGGRSAQSERSGASGVERTGDHDRRQCRRQACEARCRGRRAERRHERGAKRARGRCRRATDVCTRKRAAPPSPVAGDDDAARDVLRVRRRSGAPGCRAASPCRRGSR